MNKSIKEKGIVVYSTNSCRYCVKIKKFFNDNNIEFVEKVISSDTEDGLKNRKTIIDLDLKTVPQVFIGGSLVGGCDETIKYLSKPKSFQEYVKDPATQKGFAFSINALQDLCHGLAREGGWWDRKGDALAAHELLKGGTVTDEATKTLLRRVADQERNPLELLALITSEVSEALEGVRKDQMDDKLPHRKMEEVELADVIVRVLDYAGGRGLDVGGALIEKLVFNITREDHQPENRAKIGGKKY